jgi:cysteine desulfurase
MAIPHLEFLKHLFRVKRHVYLDHNATTRVSSRVQRTMNRVLRRSYGNPSSLYSIARKSAEIMDDARRHVAHAVGADSHEILFTGCATESNNAVLKSVSAHFYPRKKKIISSPIEHPSVMKTLQFLTTQGIVVEYCPVDRYGRVNPSEIENLIDEDTFLVCCMLANNEIGTVQDVRAIAEISRRRGVLVLSDCVQAFGKIPVDVHGLGVDYASFSAHKLHGPKGVGALYVKQGSPFAPLLHGGHQEEGLRAGTEGLHNIAGFGTACRDVNKLLAQAGRIGTLKQQIIDRLRLIKPDCVVNSPDTGCLPNTANITFPNTSNAALLAMFDYHGIAVSAGSACNTHDDKPSDTLKAIGLSDRAAKETVRFSLGSETTARDIRYTAWAFREYVEGRSLLVNIVSPLELDEPFLLDEQNYILDVRTQGLRKKVKSLPNAHEVSFTAIGKSLHLLPRDKHILVVCQGGGLSYIAAYFLRAKGFERVSSLRTGVCGWKERRGDLYHRLAGQNVTSVRATG